MTKKKDPSRVKAKTGRPTAWGRVNPRAVETLAKAGFTDEEMAAAFGVTHQTWKNWKKKHPEFFATVKDWKAEADRKVERSLFERATGYKHEAVKIFNEEGLPLIVPYTEHYPPDPTSMIFWLKNRMKDEWRDTKTLDVDESVAALAERLQAARLRARDGNK